MKYVKTLLFLAFVMLFFATGSAKAAPSGTFSSVVTSTGTFSTTNFGTTTIATSYATFYYGTGFTIPPTTSYWISQNSTVKTEIVTTVFINSFGGNAPQTITVTTRIIMRTNILSFAYRSGYSPTVATNIYKNTSASNKIVTSTANITLTFHQSYTSGEIVVYTGVRYIFSGSTTTTVYFTSYIYISQTGSGTAQIVYMYITDYFWTTVTAGVIVVNTYGYSSNAVYTVYETMTAITQATPVKATTTTSALTTSFSGTPTYIYMNYSKEYLTASYNSLTYLTITEDGNVYTLTVGDYSYLTELTTSVYEKTIHDTTITTTYTGTIDAQVGVVFDAYADSQYYSTSTLTVVYHDVYTFTTTEVTTTTTTTTTATTNTTSSTPTSTITTTTSTTTTTTTTTTSTSTSSTSTISPKGGCGGCGFYFAWLLVFCDHGDRLFIWIGEFYFTIYF